VVGVAVGRLIAVGIGGGRDGPVGVVGQCRLITGAGLLGLRRSALALQVNWLVAALAEPGASTSTSAPTTPGKTPSGAHLRQSDVRQSLLSTM
jgi:hypothetical protein